LKKLKSHYPGWQITRNLARILEELIAAEESKARGGVSSRSALN
jgi:hypothetical protein